jgi:hypothetical protein
LSNIFKELSPAAHLQIHGFLCFLRGFPHDPPGRGTNESRLTGDMFRKDKRIPSEK